MSERIRDWLLFPKSRGKLTLILVLPLLLLLALLIATLVRWQKKSLDEIQISGLTEVGRAFYQHIMATTLWTRGHGGIYIEVPELTPGGPAQHDPGLQGVSVLGKRYRKLNPNFVTREIIDIVNRRGGYQFHVTSLNPSSPGAKPDPWEEQALRSFQKGVPEAVAVVEHDGVRAFRYMAPLALNDSCLRCHQWGGYKRDDVRGGLSITIPMGYSDSLYARQMKRTALSFASIGVAAIAFLIALVGYFSNRISAGYNMTLEQQEKLQRLNAQLSEILARDKKILENVADGMVIIDRDGTIETANNVFLRVVGLESSEVVGRHVDDFPADGLAALVLASNPRGGGDDRGEPPPDSPPGAFLAVRKERVRDSVEVELNDRTYTASSVFVVDAEKGGFVCELRLLHDATREKLKAAMEISGSAAHEIRQPLAILLSVKELIRDKIEKGEKPVEELDVLHDQIERVNKIIARMVAVSTYRTRRYADEMRIFDLEGPDGGTAGDGEGEAGTPRGLSS